MFKYFFFQNKNENIDSIYVNSDYKFKFRIKINKINDILLPFIKTDVKMIQILKIKEFNYQKYIIQI